MATCIGIQDFSQLRKDYGREQADLIINITGNVISGQVTGDSAKQLSERLRKIMQNRQSLSINSGDTSISKSRHLDLAVPASKIASLSSGEFVGIIADDPHNKVTLKAFHCEIIHQKSERTSQPDKLEEFGRVRMVTEGVLNRVYTQIKVDIQNVVQLGLGKIINDPSKRHYLIKK